MTITQLFKKYDFDTIEDVNSWIQMYEDYEAFIDEFDRDLSNEAWDEVLVNGYVKKEVEDA